VLPYPLLRSGEERDPVTRLLSDTAGFASGPVELRTSDGRNLRAPESANVRRRWRIPFQTNNA